MRNCSVRGCPKEFYPGCGISFHSLPKDKTLRAKWIKAIPPKTNSNLAICSMHFRPGEINISVNRSTLKAGVVPSIFPKIAEPKSSLDQPPIPTGQKSCNNNNDNSVISKGGMPTVIPVTPITCTGITQDLIKRDPLKLEDDFDDNESSEISSSTLPSNAELSSTRIKVEPIEIKQDPIEYHDHDYENSIPSSLLIPAKKQQEELSVDKINSENDDDDIKDDFKDVFSIGLDHDYENSISPRMKPPIVPSSETNQDPPKMLVGPLPSSHLSSKAAPLSTHQESPTMVIGPLPSSHLQSSVPDITAPVAMNTDYIEPPTMLIGPLTSSHLLTQQAIDNAEIRIKEHARNQKLKSMKTEKTILDLKRKVRTLQHQLRRRDIKIKNLNAKVEALSKKFTIRNLS